MWPNLIWFQYFPTGSSQSQQVLLCYVSHLSQRANEAFLFYFNTVIICFILQIEQLHTQSDISALYIYIYVYKLFYMSLLHSLLRFRVSFEQFDTDGHNRQPPTRV